MGFSLPLLIASITTVASQDVANAAETSLETESSLRWLGAPPPWITGLIVIPLLLGIVWWSYRRQHGLSRRQKVVLAALRFAGALAILIALYRPAVEVTRNLKVRTEVHFLVDDSASMGRQEAYEPERKSALLSALADAAPANLSDVRRIDLVAKLFGGGGDGAAARARGPGKELLTQLEENFDLRWYRFSERSDLIASLDDLAAKGSSTRIGDTLDLHLTNHGIDSSNLEAVVLVTDGRNNEGLSPIEGASRLQAVDVPLHVLGVGEPSGDRNLTLSGPPGPQQILQNEHAKFELEVRANGLEARGFSVRFRAKKQDAGDTTAGVDNAPVLLQEDGIVMPEAGETRKVTLEYSFDEPGDYLLTFEVPPVPGENNPRDNVTRRYLRVDSDRIRVLLLEDLPRWEYRYVYQALDRVDKSIEYQAYQFDASRSFRQEASKGVEPLKALPRTKKELFGYHVILIGDIAPARFGATEEERAEFLELIKSFVEHGGGLGLIAGERAMPEAYRETAIEDLLPVVLGDLTDAEVPVASDERFRPVLENPIAPDPIVRFLDDPADNLRLWSEGLPGMAWYYPVLRAKAGAQVLLRHPRDQNKYGRRILLATSPYPKGKVLFAAFDETWRWRRFYGVKYIDRFWRNVVRSLAENKLKRLDDRVVLTIDREQIELGERVQVDLQLLDEDYNPVLDDEARLHVRTATGDLQSITLQRLQGQPGRFEGTLSIEEPGVSSLLYYRDADPSGRPLARRDIITTVPKRELEETSLDEAGMIELAAAGKGKYVPLHAAADLLEGFEGRGAGMKIVDRKMREVWDQAWTLLLVLALLTAEWILRKKWRLV
ncbi:MAG: VWA domain-containing protein [Planctomycetes bacterium]|nr:VWA domain-containing protein [Planctomycetota bacterium]